MGGGTSAHLLFASPLSQLSGCIVALVCLAAIFWGRWPERFGALVTAFNWIASPIVQDQHWDHHGQPGVFAVDAIMLVAFVGLTMRCRRTWVMWAAACSLLLNFTDLCLLLDTRIQVWSYVTASYVWGFGGVISLAAGTAFEGRRPAQLLSLRTAMVPTTNSPARGRSPR